MADLAEFALTCDSVATLFRRAIAAITSELRVEYAAISERSQRASGPVVTFPIAGDDRSILIGKAALAAEDVDFVRAVAAIVAQAIARDGAEQSLQTRAKQQSAIAELTRLAVNSISDETFTRACDLIIERVGVDHALFFRLDTATQVLRFRAGNRWFADDLLTLPLRATSQGAECVARNEPVIVDDYLSDTRFASARSLLDCDVRSGVIVPVTSGSGCLGILTAHARQPRTFTDDDICFIEALANILAEGLERDAARHDLAISEDRYHDVVEAASDIIFTATVDGCIVSLNSAFARITGCAVDEWIGRSVTDLTGGHRWAVGDACEVALDCPRGTVLLELSIHPKIEDGQMVAIHGFARDVTDARHAERVRRNLEAKLEQANRIAGLGRLAATVAHEFNNVLMGISPFVDVMRRGKNVESALDHISRAVTRGRRITQDILRFTQPAEPSLVDVDLETWLQTLGEEAQSLVTSAYRVQLEMSGESLNVRADPAQLQQVFTNLVLNARDAMPGGGTLSIELRRASADEPHFAIGEPERYAHIVVRDTGCGMNDEMLRHAFEPLFTTKRNGTGLGLPVALQVVQRHSGEFFVESTPGVGTTFHIFLPLAAPAAMTWPQEVFAAPDITMPRMAVLVEDDAIVATGLVGLLTLEGMAVRLVKTGEEAVEVLRRIRPDLVVLDVGLPGMDGVQVFTTLGERLATVPVIFSTGHGDRTKIESLLARANVSFLQKPYSHSDLLQTIGEVMRASKFVAA